MIDTTDIVELFKFLADDLSAHGYRVRASVITAQEVLENMHHVNEEENAELVLDFSLSEFRRTLRVLGSGAEFMWPGSTTESAGLRLMLTHLDEQRATKNLGTGGLRLSLWQSEPILTAA